MTSAFWQLVLGFNFARGVGGRVGGARNTADPDGEVRECYQRGGASGLLASFRAFRTWRVS